MTDQPRRTFEIPEGAIQRAEQDQAAAAREIELGKRAAQHRSILAIEADGEQTCRSCATAIVWAFRDEGQAVPINREPDPEGTVGVNQHDEWVFGLTRRAPGQLELETGDQEPPRYRLHFETCPDRDRWHRWGLQRRQQDRAGDR